MPQDQIRFCTECKTWRHRTNFTPGINYCKWCSTIILPYATEGVIAPDGTMKDSEYEEYMMEPIMRSRRGQSRERVNTALKPYIDMGRFPTRRPVKRRRR